MVPKKLHYCWFGKGELPELYKECISTWGANMPEYEIFLWTEDNISIDTPFLSYAIKNKKWAFVSDYIRLRAIEQHGGVYLDTDIEVIKSFDSLLKYSCFLGYEDVGRLNTAVLGAVAGHPFIKDCRELMEERFANNKPYLIAPEVASVCAEKYLSDNDFFTCPEEYFYPYNPYAKHDRKFLMNKYVTENTYAIHHWGKGWKLGFFDRLKKKFECLA
ncbi:glycosyltransferase [Modicisalibacter xianhensis]|nr:glycosyltransferase [Halomonas xianhensis]